MTSILRADRRYGDDARDSGGERTTHPPEPQSPAFDQPRIRSPALARDTFAYGEIAYSQRFGFVFRFSSGFAFGFGFGLMLDFVERAAFEERAIRFFYSHADGTPPAFPVVHVVNPVAFGLHPIRSSRVGRRPACD